MSKSSTFANQALDFKLGSGDPAVLYVALSLANPGVDGSGLLEPPVGGNYQRTGIVNNVVNFPPASAQSKSNPVEVEFSTPTSPWGTITHVAFFDDPIAGTMVYYDPLLAPVSIFAGDTVRFDIGGLIFTEE